MVELLWYLVICASVIFYVLLDGFDLGVGCLHLFVKEDTHRRLFLNAIGPVWDGNEVWLVIIFGGLFAGFPPVYATICSGFYFLIMLCVAGLMFRGGAIEFRSKHPSLFWRKLWDVFFSLASYLIAFTIGVIMANLICGLAIDEHGDFVGTFWSFFTPYTLLVGVTGISLFMMHGALYLLMKIEGDLSDQIRKWVYPLLCFFALSYFMTTLATFAYEPHMVAPMKEHPYLFCIPLGVLLALTQVWRYTRQKKVGRAFIYSCLSLTLLFTLFGIGTFPHFVRSTINQEAFSLTLYNAAASKKTLQILLTVVIIGMPFTFAYGFWIYRIFRGKIKLDESSY